MFRQLDLSRWKAATPVEPAPTVSIEPTLPPELERIIFFYAYQNERKDVKNLVRVARRVEEWLCPSILNVVVILFPKRKDLSLSGILHYGKYITHLAIELSVFKPFNEEGFVDVVFRSRQKVLRQLLDEILLACPNLVNLWAFTDPFNNSKWLFPVISPQIAHLGIQMRLLLNQLSLPPNPPKSKTNSPQPMFPGVTHLYMYDHIGKEDIKTKLLAFHFPNLTHIMLSIFSAADELKLILERCTKLEFVVMSHELPAGEIGTQLNDSRIVEIHANAFQLWEIGARGLGADIWEVARLKKEGLARRG